MSNEGQELPAQFGRYTLVARLAVGGMAEVFRAKISASHGFEKILVIKRILPHLAVDKTFVAMFIDEAKLTAQLMHPKIVQVTDFGEVQGQYFIALEYIDGFDALALLRSCAHKRIHLPIHLGVFLVVEMLDALDYAHHAVDAEGRPMKLVHRDISPSNVFISRRGDVKLGDFGIAHASERESKTQAGTLKGKYGYMSPEQVTGSVLDGRSDVFAVGIVLAEMLMGRRLFTAANDLDVLLMVRDGRLDRLDKYCKDVPPTLDTIVRKALKKSLHERYQTAAEFRDALADWLFQVGKRVATSDLGAFTRDLFDESPEALKRLQEQQARLKAELDALLAGGGRGAMPPLAAPAMAPSMSGMPGMSAARSTGNVSREAVGGAGGVPVASRRSSAGMPARREVEDAADMTDEPSAPIALDAEDLEPVTGHRPVRVVEADPKIAAALESALANALSVVDLEQWGGEPGAGPALDDPGGGPGGGLPEHWASAQAPAMQVGAGRQSAAMPAMAPGIGPPLTSGVNPAMLSGMNPATGRAAVGQFVSGTPQRPADTTGDLAAVSPIRIFASLAVAGETGMMRFDLGPHVKEVFVSSGTPQSINSTVPGERFGEYLVGQGVLRPEQLEQALTLLPRYSGKLGDTLVGMGILKPMEVFRLLSQQVRDRVMDVFSLARGSFAYYRGVTNPQEAFPLGLDPFEILGAGVLTLPPGFLEGRLGPVLDERPRAAPGQPVSPDAFRLGPTPREVLGLLDGTRSIRQWLAHFSGAEEQLTFLRTVYLLIETDLVQVR